MGCRLPDAGVATVLSDTETPLFERVTSLATTKSDLALLLWKVLDVQQLKSEERVAIEVCPTGG
jgi:hypothetical protein